METALEPGEAEELAELLKALADPVRIRIVSLVATAPDGEICACDLPAIFDRSQPTMSHHLRQLVDAGVLDREARGKWAWFSLRPGVLESLGDALAAATTPATPVAP